MPNILHVISAQQFNRESLEQLFQSSMEMEKLEASGGVLKHNGKIMTSLFFEASTRTRLSFESAMIRLGGRVIGTENAAQFSSTIKGESLEDTIRVISGYSDLIVMRHTEIGAASRAAGVSSVPIINAGDGAGEHPTQALLDLYSIQKEVGRIDDLHIAMIGDLAYGRTVHSLSIMLANFQGIKITYISPENVTIPPYIKRYLSEHRVQFTETTDLNAACDVDVLYQTRIQKERFPILAEYEKAAGRYIINPQLLDKLRNDAVILHPLPRSGEITDEVDKDPRAAYFRQAHNGLFIRMALIDRCLAYLRP